jgi:hypothetical protein
VKYLAFLIIIGITACSSNNTSSESNRLWEYIPQNHHDSWDQDAFNIINGYQSILKGLTANDSSFLLAATQQLLANTDSIIKKVPTTDSLQQTIIVGGLQALNGELEALVLDTHPVAVNAEVQMLSIELIHYLGQIGYQKSNIYIFKIPVDNKEDLVWLGLSKTSKNPYNNLDKEMYTAAEILQEP